MRRFELRSSQIDAANGIAFEAPDEATEDEIAAAAFEAISEILDYTWDEVMEDAS